ncbi:MAG: BlaI/MecI/CopY family transcriptional regulator [Saprospiraceae bacterium]|nr:BlaI/MecI/CopY family transcriptional regulator [Saprospiraceae bacterium]
MKKPDQHRPTEAEMAILQILWETGPVSVRTVHETLYPTGDAGYTTTLKLMQIMVSKGLAKRNTEQRTHIYRANVQEKIAKQNLVTKLVNLAFKGSESQLVMQVLGNRNASPEELQQIKDMISLIESNQNNS